jgi:ABC-type transport system involved in multi-copper enzyme maturation permease subunit
VTGLAWVGWRHQRWVLISAVGLIAACALLTTQNNYPGGYNRFTQQVGQWGTPGFFVPVALGLFWGAPLLARELQKGTIDLAYTQSVSRARWLAVRVLPLLVIGPLTLLGVLAAAYETTPVNARYEAVLEGEVGFRQAPVEMVLVLFTLTLGLLAGALLRRTVPAMAATMAGYYVIDFHLLTLVHNLVPLRHTVLQEASPAYEKLFTGGGAFFSDTPLNATGLVRLNYWSAHDLQTIDRLQGAALLLASALMLGATFWWMTRREPRA